MAAMDSETDDKVDLCVDTRPLGHDHVIDDGQIHRKNLVYSLLMSPQAQMFTASVLQIFQQGRLGLIPMLKASEMFVDMRGYIFPAFCLYVIKGNYLDVAIPMVDRIVRVKVALANATVSQEKNDQAKSVLKRLCGIEPVSPNTRWLSLKVKRATKLPTVIGSLVNTDGINLSHELLRTELASEYVSTRQYHAAGQAQHYPAQESEHE